MKKAQVNSVMLSLNAIFADKSIKMIKMIKMIMMGPKATDKVKFHLVSKNSLSLSLTVIQFHIFTRKGHVCYLK